LKKLIYILILFLSLGYLYSCEDEKYLSSTNVKLLFSVDTVMFDTVFTTIGSSTQHLKVYNPYNQKVLISSIKLAKAQTSNFRLNINGVSSNEVQNLELAPFDSLYIFVEVTVDPSGQNLPLVVKDSIEFVTNTNRQDVDLVAWGQDFKLIKGKISKNAIWTNEKPYLVYTDAYVDSSSTLTIEAGTKVYFRKEAGLHVEGRVVAKGSVENPIIFHGDRLETVYSNVPDQWDGITLYPGSKNNEFLNVEIKNAYIGLFIGNVGDKGSSDVILNNVKIQNMAYAGIFAVESDIKASNCLITNCGYYAVALLVGGNYEFNHSTIANYWREYGFKARTSPAVYISNILNVAKDKKDYVGDVAKADFSNCIITGNVVNNNELYLKANTDKIFNYKFDRCVIQLDKTDVFKTNTQHYLNCFKIRPDSIFVDPYKKFNFELDTLSKAKDVADKTISKIYPTDLKGRNRFLDNGPDIGAMERQEKKTKKR
jgi:hypothetical protein